MKSISLPKHVPPISDVGRSSNGKLKKGCKFHFFLMTRTDWKHSLLVPVERIYQICEEKLKHNPLGRNC